MQEFSFDRAEQAEKQLFSEAREYPPNFAIWRARCIALAEVPEYLRLVSGDDREPSPEELEHGRARITEMRESLNSRIKTLSGDDRAPDGPRPPDPSGSADQADDQDRPASTQGA